MSLREVSINFANLARFVDGRLFESLTPQSAEPGFGSSAQRDICPSRTGTITRAPQGLRLSDKRACLVDVSLWSEYRRVRGVRFHAKALQKGARKGWRQTMPPASERSWSAKSDHFLKGRLRKSLAGHLSACLVRYPPAVLFRTPSSAGPPIKDRPQHTPDAARD